MAPSGARVAPRRSSTPPPYQHSSRPPRKFLDVLWKSSGSKIATATISSASWSVVGTSPRLTDRAAAAPASMLAAHGPDGQADDPLIDIARPPPGSPVQRSVASHPGDRHRAAPRTDGPRRLGRSALARAVARPRIARATRHTLTTAIGRSIPRVDGGPKVTGSARFAADIGARGLLHARPVLALPAHALIERIDASAALALPGVVAVLTAADLPIVTEGTDRIHEPLARREILWAGQPVALVIAETPEAAADAAALVMVETTPLEPILDLDLAVAPRLPARAASGRSRRPARAANRSTPPSVAAPRSSPRTKPSPTTLSREAATDAATWPRRWREAMSSSRAGSRRAGSTRAISSRRSRWPSSTTTGSSISRARRRARSIPARSWPSCSAGRSPRSG